MQDIQKKKYTRESYKYRRVKCFKTSFYGLKECLGEGFEEESDVVIGRPKSSSLDEELKELDDKSEGEGIKELKVCRGIYYGKDIQIKMLHTGKILHHVYVRYYGNNPNVDLMELREVFKMIGLRRRS